MLELVELAGSQGVELLNLLVARGALSESVTKVHSHYYVPISNTDPTFVQALRPRTVSLQALITLEIADNRSVSTKISGTTRAEWI